MGPIDKDRIRSAKADLRATPKVDFSKQLDYGVVRGKTALVLDAATGLGLGIAMALAEAGAHVAILDHSEESGLKSEKTLCDKGYTVKFFQTEAWEWESQLAAFKGVLEWSNNQLDIVVTTTGIVTNNLLLSVLPKHCAPEDDPPKPPTKTMQVNVFGVYFTTSLALSYFNRLWDKRLDPNFRPQLLFICSLAGYEALDFGTDYAASKQGTRAIWKTTRKPRPGMAKYQSNLLAPTYVRQGKLERSEEDLKNHHHQTNEIEDVVAGAMRCICDDAIEGRSICCVQGSTGTPGQLNFDLCDDLIDQNGGKELLNRVEDIWLPSSAKLSEDSNCAVQ